MTDTDGHSAPTQEQTLYSEPVICNFNFHSSVGGTQHTLCTILDLLSRKYRVLAVDPYLNPEFKILLLSKNISVDPVFHMGRRNYVSQRSGWRKIVDLPKISPQYVKLAIHFRRYLRDQDVKLVYVNQVKSALFAVACVPTYIPILYHCHGVSSTGFDLIVKSRRRIAHVIANSQFTAEQLASHGFPPESMSVVSNTISVQEVLLKSQAEPVSPLPSNRKQPVLLLAHAGIESNKGTIVALKAFAQVIDAGTPCDLWVSGEESKAHSKYIQRVKHFVAEAGLQDCVHFLGRRSDIYAVMRRADIVIVPSLVEESFGRVAPEAMVLGKVVVVSNRGALPNHIVDQVSGCVFDPDSPEMLANIVLELLADPEKMRRISEHAQASAQARSDLETYAELLYEVFDKMSK